MGCWVLVGMSAAQAAQAPQVNPSVEGTEKTSADPTPATPAQPPVPTQGAATPAVPAQPNLSIDEMRQAAKNYVTKMGDKFTDVSTKAAQAKNENNISRYNCLNTKATLIGGLLTMGNSVYVEMSTSNDVGLLKGDLQKIEIAWNKVNSTATEAEGCFGNLAFKSGAETVDVTTPADLPKGDPTTNTIPVNVEGRSTSTSLSM